MNLNRILLLSIIMMLAVASTGCFYHDLIVGKWVYANPTTDESIVLKCDCDGDGYYELTSTSQHIHVNINWLSAMDNQSYTEYIINNPNYPIGHAYVLKTDTNAMLLNISSPEVHILKKSGY